MDEAALLNALRAEPIDDLGFAQVDAHRALQQGFPEVVFGAGKTPEQVASIAAKVMDREDRVLVTRADAAHAVAVAAKLPEATYHESARCITVEAKRLAKRGSIAVLCAGTSDLPVADEAAVTADFMGNEVLRVNDVGVAGLHRLLASMPRVREASVIIAVAGMEGTTQRGGRAGAPAGDRRPDKHRLRGELRRVGGAAWHAQQLRQRRDGGQHRQRFRGRLRREPNQLPANESPS